MELLQRIGDATNTEFVIPRVRFLDWLRGERRHGNTLGSDEHDEAACTADHPSARQPLVRVRLVPAARDAALLRRRVRGGVRASRARPRISCRIARDSSHAASKRWSCRSRLRHCTPAADDKRRVTFDGELALNRELLRQWAKGCPENYGHLHLLVEAEAARIARRADRGGRPLRPRDQRRARAELREHRGARGRGRRALLAGRQQARLREAVRREGVARLRGLGRPRQGRRPARGARSRARRALRPPRRRPARRRSAARATPAATPSTSRRCSRRARRSPAKSCSSACSAL